MGFRRGQVTHSNGYGIHCFKNDPDKTHQTCVRCGCKRVKTYKNRTGQQIATYYDRYGNELDCIPMECKSSLDLLNEENT